MYEDEPYSNTVDIDIHEKALDAIFKLSTLEKEFVEDTKFSSDYESTMTANLDTSTILGKWSVRAARIKFRIDELESKILERKAKISDDYRKEIANHRVANKNELEDRIALDKEHLGLLNKLYKNQAKAKLIERFAEYILKNRNYNIGYHIDLMKFKDKTAWNF